MRPEPALSPDALVALILAHAPPVLPLEARDATRFRAGVRVLYTGAGARAALGVVDARRGEYAYDLLLTAPDLAGTWLALRVLASLLRDRLELRGDAAAAHRALASVLGPPAGRRAVRGAPRRRA